MSYRITIDHCFVTYLCVYVYIHPVCIYVCEFKNKKHAAWPD